MENNENTEQFLNGATVIASQSLPLRIATLAEVEEKHIRMALVLVGGSKTKAAKALGISVKTIYNKLAEYDAKATQIVRSDT